MPTLDEILGISKPEDNQQDLGSILGIEPKPGMFDSPIEPAAPIVGDFSSGLDSQPPIGLQPITEYGPYEFLTPEQAAVSPQIRPPDLSDKLLRNPFTKRVEGIGRSIGGLLAKVGLGGSDLILRPITNSAIATLPEGSQLRQEAESFKRHLDQVQDAANILVGRQSSIEEQSRANLRIASENLPGPLGGGATAVGAEVLANVPEIPAAALVKSIGVSAGLAIAARSAMKKSSMRLAAREAERAGIRTADEAAEFLAREYGEAGSTVVVREAGEETAEEVATRLAAIAEDSASTRFSPGKRMFDRGKLPQTAEETTGFIEDIATQAALAPDSPIKSYSSRVASRVAAKDIGVVSPGRAEADQLIESAMNSGDHLSSLFMREGTAPISVDARTELIDAVSDQVAHEARNIRVLKKSPPTLEPKRNPLSMLMREGLARPETIMDAAGPELKTLVWEGIGVRGFEKESTTRLAHQDFLRGVVEDITGTKWGTRSLTRWQKSKQTIPTAFGETRLTNGEIIELLGSLKDPSTREAVLKRGFVLDRLFGGSKEIRLSEVELLNLERRFAGTPEAQVADSIVQRYGVARGQINEPSLRVMGRRIAKEGVDDGPRSEIPKAFRDIQSKILREMDEGRVPFEEPPAGTLDLQGALFPGAEKGIVTNTYYPRRVRRTKSLERQKMTTEFSQMYDELLTSSGHLKRRTGGGGPVIIGDALETYSQHMDMVSRVHAYLEPNLVAHSVLDRAAPAIEGTIGEIGRKRIIDAIDMQTTRMAPHGLSNRIVKGLMRNFAGAKLAGPGPVAVQFSGLPVAASYQPQGFRNLSEAVVEAIPRRAEIEKRALKWAPYWRVRYEGGFSYQAAGGAIGQSTMHFGSKPLAERSLFFLEKSDKAGGYVRYLMAEKHVLRNSPHLAAGSDEFERAVAREWSRLMFRSENTAHGMEMAGLLAAGKRHPFLGTFTMFKSSTSKIYSLLPRAAEMLRAGDRAGAARNLAAFVASMSYTTAGRMAVRGVRGKLSGDKKIESPKEAAKEVGKTFLVESISLPPILGEIVSPAVKAILGEGVYTFPMTILESLYDETVGTEVALVEALESSIKDELDDDLNPEARGKWNDFLDKYATLGGSIFGVGYEGLKQYWDITKYLGEAAGIRVEGVDTEPSRDEETQAALDKMKGRKPFDREISTQATRWIRRGLMDGDSGSFRKGLEKMKESGKPVTRKNILSAITRYKPFMGISELRSKVNPVTGQESNKKRQDFVDAGGDLEKLDHDLALRDAWIEAATAYMLENDDIIEDFAGNESDFLQQLKDFNP